MWQSAGVSQATVSMVLNKKYNVSFSKEVIQKVEAAAENWGMNFRNAEHSVSDEKNCSLSSAQPDKPILCNAFARN